MGNSSGRIPKRHLRCLFFSFLLVPSPAKIPVYVSTGFYPVVVLVLCWPDIGLNGDWRRWKCGMGWDGMAENGSGQLAWGGMEMAWHGPPNNCITCMAATSQPTKAVSAERRKYPVLPVRCVHPSIELVMTLCDSISIRYRPSLVFPLSARGNEMSGRACS